MKLKDMRIGKRLGIGFGLLVLMMVALVIAGIVATRGMNAKLNQIVKINNAKVEAAQNFLTGTKTTSALLLGAMATKDEALRDQSMQAVATTRTEYMSWMDKLEKIEDTAKGKEIIKGIREGMAAAAGSSGKSMELMKSGRADEAATGFLTWFIKNMQDQSNDAVAKLIAYQKEDVTRRYDEAQSAYHRTMAFLIIMGALIVAVALAMTYILTRGIVEPIQHSIEVARMLEAGRLDMDVAVDRGDEFGDMAISMKGLVEKWREVIGSIRDASDNVARASTELSAGAEQMSKGAGQQAERSHQVATASQEMSQTVLDVAGNASNIASTANSAATTAKDGGRIVEEAVKEVKEIAVTVEESSGHITSLAELSQRIGEIIGIINEIADQTNLLALNAAIEAARAGEHGRGFAVVADEVRKLAERTTGATSEVSGIIKEIQNKVGSAVSSIDKVSAKVDRGVELSSKAGSELTNIVGSVEDLQSMVHQVASAIEEMSATSDQISQDIESISGVSKETARSSEEVASSSVELSRLGSSLQAIARQFEL
jgi:methyl-accepting chemotaxis protein